ncbi:amine oxidase [Aureococcus anophagefferens]|uniref:Amine oxidase n=1 Tax=Aureococcus anophagefferens TaxID=44056 RepID=A0ABR1GCG3_AURAN|nr:oxidoreductase [Aureococcus anophagefferens]
MFKLVVVVAALARADEALERHRAEVLIVGAGYAGLAAGRVLAAAGVDVRILEARSRAGGRTLNEDVVTGRRNVATDDVIALGGEWLAPEHAAARRLIETELGFGVFHRPFNAARNESLRIVVETSAGRAYTTSDAGVASAWPPAARAEIARLSAAFGALAAEVPCGDPLAHHADADAASFESWLRDGGVTTPEAHYALSAFADDAESLGAMGLLGVLWTYNCTDASEDSEKEDWYRVRGGTQGPALALAARLDVDYDTPADSVAKNSDGTFAVVSLAARRAYVADRVLLAGLAPPLLNGIDFDPLLPAGTAQLLQRVPMGTSLKYSLVYAAPWWRGLGFLGKIVVADGRETYASLCLDNSPESWRRGVLSCFVEGDGNRRLFRDFATRADRADAIEALVLDAFSVTEPPTPRLAAIEHDWAHRRYSRGAYGSFLPPGALSSFWPELEAMAFDHRFRGYEDRVYVAGSDYARKNPGYIDGAVVSGEDAAAAILRDLRRA